MARWDVWDAYDAWDNGFLKFAFGASRWNLAKHLQGAFAHGIPHEMIEASFMCEALRHLLLENQMSYASHASYTSHPQAESKARSTPPTHQPTTTPTNKKGNTS